MSKIRKTRFTFRGNTENDIALLEQVETLNPFRTKNSTESTRIWREIATNLKNGELKMDVTARSCKERTNLLMKQLSKTVNDGEAHREDGEPKWQGNGKTKHEEPRPIPIIPAISAEPDDTGYRVVVTKLAEIQSPPQTIINSIESSKAGTAGGSSSNWKDTVDSQTSYVDVDADIDARNALSQLASRVDKIEKQLATILLWINSQHGNVNIPSQSTRTDGLDSGPHIGKRKQVFSPDKTTNMNMSPCVRIERLSKEVFPTTFVLPSPIMNFSISTTATAYEDQSTPTTSQFLAISPHKVESQVLSDCSEHDLAENPWTTVPVLIEEQDIKAESVCDIDDPLFLFVNSPETETSFIDTTGDNDKQSHFYCAHCNTKYSTASELAVHQLTHSVLELSSKMTNPGDGTGANTKEGEKNSQTESPLKSGKRTRTSTNTYKRRRIGGPFPCETCPRILSTVSSYNKHKKLQHSNFRRPQFTCELCSKPYLDKSSLTTHMTAQHGQNQNPYLCSVCGKGFSRITYLQDHALTHSEVRSYKCKYCDASFRQKQGLNVHIIRHLRGRKDWHSQCSQCGQTFTTAYSLGQHIKHIHEKIRAHSCSVCSKSFKTTTHLKYHIGTHSNPNSKNRGLNRDEGVARIKRVGGVYRIKQVSKEVDQVESEEPGPSAE